MAEFKLGLKPDEKDDRDFLYKSVRNTSEKVTYDNVDLRGCMPSMFSQNQQSSCTGNTGVCVAEYLFNVQKDKKLTLSRQYLYNMERINDGCPLTQDEGSSMRQICKTLRKNGCCEEIFFTYGNGNEFIEPDELAKDNAQKYKIGSYYRCQNFTDIKVALSSGLPVLVGTEIYDSMWTIKDDGVMPKIDKKKDEFQGLHAWTLCGYTSKKNIFGKRQFTYILRTSWGESIETEDSWGYSYTTPSDLGYGDHGYAYITEDDLKKILVDAWVICDVELNENAEQVGE